MRLPKIATELAVTSAPGTSVSPSAVASSQRAPDRAVPLANPALTPTPYAALADAIGNVGAYLTNVGDQYQQASMAARIAKEQQDARNQALDLALKSNGNPDVFKSAWDTYVSKRLPTYPDKLRLSMEASFAEIGGGTYRNITETTFNRDMGASKKTLTDEIAFQNDRITAMARGGLAGTPEFAKAKAGLNDIYAQLTGNPLFGVTKESADLDLKRYESQWTAQGIIGHALETYRTKGAAAAEAEADSLLTDPNLALSADERQGYRRLYIQELATENAKRDAVLKQAQSDAEDLAKRLKADQRLVDDPTVDRVANSLFGLGDVAGATKLLTARARERQLAGFRTTSDAEQNAAYAGLFTGRNSSNLGGSVGANASSAMSFFIGQGWSQEQAAGIVANLITESNLNPAGPAGDGGLAKGIAQWHPDRHANLIGFASANGLDPTSLDTQLKFVQWELTNTESAAAEKLKGAKTAAEAAAIIDQYYERSAGTARGKRVNLAMRLTGAKYGTYAGAPATMSFTYDPSVDPDAITAMQAEISADFNRNFSAMTDGLKAGMPPSAEAIQVLADEVAIVNDADSREKLSTFLQTWQDGALLSNLSPADAQNLVDRLKAGVTRNGQDGIDLATQSYFTGLQQQIDARAEKLRTDPLQAYIDTARPTYPPLDPANQETFGAAIAARAQGAEETRSLYKIGPVPALTLAEQKQLGAYWAGADTNQRIALLSTLSGAIPDGDTLMATLGSFADKKDTQMLSIAGAWSRTQPEVAASILRGEQALATNPKFGFTANEESDQKTTDYFPATTVAPSHTEAWNAHIEAARAVYADMSARAGDTSGTFKEDRWRRAIDTVTGGLVDFNGQKTFAPAPGVGQQKFDEVMASLPARALAGAMTPDGTPVPLDYLRRLGTLQGYGDGRYVINLGTTTGLLDTGVYALRGARSPSEAGIGGPFVLDLRPYLVPGWQSNPPPPTQTTEEAFRTYQQDVGAGNAAPPPLTPPSRPGTDQGAVDNADKILKQLIK